MILWEIKLLLFITSLSGYVFLWPCIDRKIKFEFIPIVVVSVISNILLLFAYVGLLKPVSVVIYIGGFAALIYALYYKKNDIRIKYNYILFIIGAVVISFFVYGKMFNEHDSYSHYGIMVKRMLLHDALPDATDTVIIFKSYPAAMSCFMYMSCIFNDGADWTMTATQAIVLVACVYSLLSVVKNNRILSYIYVVAVGYGMVFYCNFITSLMLDTIIPLLGAVAFLMFFEYKDKSEDYFPYIAIILSFCVLTKNSGFAFVAAMAIVALIFAKNTRIKSVVYTLIIPAFMYVLWTIHVKIAFPGGMESNHAMSVEHYADVYSTRSSEMIKAICASFYDRMFNRPNPGLYILTMFAVAMAIHYLTKQSKIKDTLHIIVSIFVTYIIWIAGTLGMYIFSMEDTKPSLLDCFERYRSSGEMFCVCVISYLVLKQIEKLELARYAQAIKGIRITVLPQKKSEKKSNFKQNIMFISPLINFLLLFVAVIPLWTNRHIGERTSISTEYRENISETIEGYKLEADLTYLIYGEDDFDYKVIEGNMLSPFRPFFTVQYELNSRKLVFANSETLDEALTWYDYDVIIFVEDDEKGDEYKITNGYNASEKIIFKE